MFQQQIDMGEPAWGRCPANPGRREILGERRAAREPRRDPAPVSLPADADVGELRRLLAELASAQPLPAGVTVTAAALRGVPTAEITVAGIEPRHVVLYFHGGVTSWGTPSRPPAWPPRLAGVDPRRPRMALTIMPYGRL